MPEYKPTPGCRCLICGQRITSEEKFISSKIKRHGVKFAHLTCWNDEQAERAKEEKDANA